MPVAADLARRMARLSRSMFMVILTGPDAAIRRRICRVPSLSATRSPGLGSFIVNPPEFPPDRRSENPDDISTACEPCRENLPRSQYLYVCFHTFALPLSVPDHTPD